MGDVVEGMAPVRFGNGTVEPPPVDSEHSCSSVESVTTRSLMRPRFCKFEYDHQLSVFVPLCASFLVDRKPALPQHLFNAEEGMCVPVCVRVH